MGTYVLHEHTFLSRSGGELHSEEWFYWRSGYGRGLSPSIIARPFYPEHEHHSGLERQIEVVDPSRHLGEEYPSVDVQRRYGRT